MMVSDLCESLLHRTGIVMGPELFEACLRRTENDYEALRFTAEHSDGRMEVEDRRLGRRISVVRTWLNNVRTPFQHLESQEVVFKNKKVLIEFDLRGKSEGGIIYPLIMPQTRIFFPDLEQDLVPFCPGLFWVIPEIIARQAADLQELLPDFLDVAIVKDMPRFGTPCAFRGNWQPTDYDLLFLTRQIYQMLIDGRDYAPKDSLNPEAALYFSEPARRSLFPFEEPIPVLKIESAPRPVKKERSFRLEKVA